MIGIYELARTAQGKLMREVELKDLDLRRLCGHANLYDALLKDLTRAKEQQESDNMTQAIKSYLNRRQDDCQESADGAVEKVKAVEDDALQYSYTEQQNGVDSNYDEDVDSESNYDSDEYDEEWDEYDCEFELCRSSELVEAVAVAMDKFGLEKEDVEKDPDWSFRPGGREVSTFRWKSPAVSGMNLRT